MLLKHKVTKLPKDIKKESVIDAIMSIIMVCGFDFFAFFLQIGKDKVANGQILLGLVLLALYYVSSALKDFLNVWFSDVRDTHREHSTSVVNETVVKIFLKCRGKVFRYDKSTETNEVMSTNALLESAMRYVDNVWNFKLGLPAKIFQVISLVILFTGFLKVTSLELKRKELFIVIIAVLLIVSVVLSCFRNKVSKKNRKLSKEKRELQLTWKNDVLNIEPVSEKHGRLMAERYIKATRELFDITRKSRKKINKINVCDSTIKALGIVAVIILKVEEIGIENVDMVVVMGIISLVTIFSQIINRISSIVRLAEQVKENLDDIKIYEEDFINIINVYDNIDENQEKASEEEFSEFEVPEFEVTYKQKGKEDPFTLKNENTRRYTPGTMVLCNGPTGSGKSTYLKMITLRILFSNFVANLPKGIETIMHQTDSRLGEGSVLSEIILSDENDDVDIDKLTDILKGLCLYDMICSRHPDIVEYLSKAKYDEFSSGQKQRLVIARLLYNLDESTKIVALDEATNALNDDVCEKVMKFIKAFCSDKIIFVATHQVSIVEPMCDHKLVFKEEELNKFKI